MTAIELAKPRVIVIEDRGKKYSLKLDRITKKQWLKYFEGIMSTSENKGGKRVNHFESTGALVELVELLLIGAEGYATADGSPIAQVAGWQQLVPLRHRQAVGGAIVDVHRDDPSEEETIVLGAEAISLTAVWGADEAGVMRKFSGLRHCFKTPSAQHQGRYSRDSNCSVIVGGRRGITRWLGVQATLIELYDELIQSVEGYTVNGVELGSDRTAIVGEMDAYHKVVAAASLFEAAEPNVMEEAQ